MSCFPCKSTPNACSQVLRSNPCSYDPHSDNKAKMSSCTIPFTRNQVKTWKLLVQNNTANNGNCRSKGCLKATVFIILEVWVGKPGLKSTETERKLCSMGSDNISPKLPILSTVCKTDMSYHVAGVAAFFYCLLRARQSFITTIIYFFKFIFNFWVHVRAK